MKRISSMIVSTGQITDKKIEELMKILFAKHILSDEEILSCLCKKNSLKYSDLITYMKYVGTDSQNMLRIIYDAHSSGISITISLIYENELTAQEKEKINISSILKLY